MKLFIVFLFLFSFNSIGNDQVFVGAANIDATPAVGVPIAGYASGKRRLLPWDIFRRYPYAKYFKPNQGHIDPIRTKAFIVENNSQKLLFVSLDLVGTIHHFKTDILERISHLGFNEENTFITSTHTHSGPGALTYNKVWSLLAMDKFSRKVYQEFMDNIVATIEMADENKVAAKLVSGSFEVFDVQKNRAGKPGHFDNNANVILAKSSANGDWLGGIVNFAIHGTALGSKNRMFSSDVLGAIEREVENRLSQENSKLANHPSILLINGALGDVTPITKGEQGMSMISNKFADYMMDSIDTFSPMNPNWKIYKTEVKLGRPGLSLYNCTKRSWVGRLFGWNRFLRKLRFSLRRWLPYRENLFAVKFENILMVTWPGEPTTTLGDMMKEVGSELGVEQTWNMALTNNHLAYFVTRDEEREGTSEACSSLYSSKVSYRIIDTYRNLINSIK